MTTTFMINPRPKDTFVRAVAPPQETDAASFSPASAEAPLGVRGAHARLQLVARLASLEMLEDSRRRMS